MPEGFVFNQDDFSRFKMVMRAIGFILIKPKAGRQEGFEYFKNGLRVKVWTTFDSSLGKTRDDGTGKVVILESNRVSYMGTPKNRTKYFFENLFMYALAAKHHVDNRPYSKCHRLMNIYQGEVHKGKEGAEEQSTSKRQCFWVCPVKSHRHKGGCAAKPWSLGLPNEILSVMVRKWDKAEKYYNKLREQGKEVNVFLKIRRSWKEKFGDFQGTEETA